MRSYQITEFVHFFLQEHIQSGDLCIDATVGNGGDTEFLCKLVGPQGRVIGLDIQKQALDYTRQRLKTRQLEAELILDGHQNLLNYVEEGTAAGVVFNFGYLPGGDHNIATKPDTSLQALKAALLAIKCGGIVSLCIYSGKDSGFEERAALLGYLKQLDPKKYLVIASSYYNRPNNPPMPCFVIRIK